MHSYMSGVCEISRPHSVPITAVFTVHFSQTTSAYNLIDNLHLRSKRKKRLFITAANSRIFVQKKAVNGLLWLLVKHQ